MLRNAARIFFDRFRGLNSYQNLENLKADSWLGSNNVTVNTTGSAEVLRSPKAFNASVGSGNPVLSLADYLNPYEHRLLFDIDLGVGDLVATYKIENDLSNTLLRSGQHNVPFISQVVNGQLYRLNKFEFIQHVVPTGALGATTWDVFNVGIAAGPAAAPVIAYSAGGTAAIDASVQISYAYMNTRTGNVSTPSPLSNQLGPSGGNSNLDIPVVASVEHGVDKVVFFATVDGGSIPYLIIDNSGNPLKAPNTTHTVTLDLSQVLVIDTLTPEPIFNSAPPTGATFMFQWKNKIFLMGFDGMGTIAASDAIYSSLESCYIGQPTESFPPLNRISASRKGENMIGGCPTQVGALFMSDLDSYLLTGYPTDKTSGPEASTAVSELLSPLNWNIGTKSPQTIRNSPFGTIWLDQALRLRIWTGYALPEEIGLALRAELAKLDLNSLYNVQGQWYQFAKDGGVYVLVGKLAGSNTQKAFFLTIYEDPDTGDRQVGFGVSDIQAYSLEPVWSGGSLVLFIGGLNQVKTIFQAAQAGDGWPNGTQIYFDVILGNDGNYQYWHRLRIDGHLDPSKLTVSIRDVIKDANNDLAPADISTATTLTPDTSFSDSDGSTFYLIDQYGRRKVLRFAFDSTIDVFREITNLEVLYNNKKRTM